MGSIPIDFYDQCLHALFVSQRQTQAKKETNNVHKFDAFVGSQPDTMEALLLKRIQPSTVSERDTTKS